MPLHVVVIATDPPRTLPEKAPHAMILWSLLALLALIIVVTMLVLWNVRQGQQIRRGARQRRKSPGVDPWAESARRLEVADTPDHETGDEHNGENRV